MLFPPYKGGSFYLLDTLLGVAGKDFLLSIMLGGILVVGRDCSLFVIGLFLEDRLRGLHDRNGPRIVRAKEALHGDEDEDECMQGRGKISSRAASLKTAEQ